MACEVVVVGGGLGGLMAAALAARAGSRVTLLEGAAELGGRGRTTTRDGFRLNLGPHALYLAGEAHEVLRELEVPIRGGKPRLPGLATWSPAGASTRGWWQVARWLAAAPLWSPATFSGQRVDAWLSERITDPGALRVAWALIRTVSYCADGDADAGRMAAQLQRALSNVLYLDGGWRSLVDGVARAARDAGAELRTGAAVRGVEPGCVWTDAERFEADEVVLAVAPAVAARLLPGSETMAALAASVRPVRAACLDVALATVPDPRCTFAAGFDVPTYLSVHSAAADLAPAGGGLVHALWYRRAGDDGDHREALEAALDGAQPGWRDVVVHARYLPSMTVACDRMRPDPPAVRLDEGLQLVGDWVGGQGWLLDACAASARRAVAGLAVRAVAA